MTNPASILFQPLRLGRLEIGGRVVKTATAETRATDAGFVSDELIAFYEPMAAAGTPLIVTGNMFVRRDGQSTPRQIGADDDDKIPGLARLTAAVHGHGSAIMAQLSHCGRQVVPPYVGRDEAVSASDVRDLSTGTLPRPLTIPEIRRIVDDFGEAARRCQDAGFDGVQIHGAHGYLIAQFLTPHTNRRTDEYGGSLQNRTRLLREVHRSIRDRVGEDFPVILKINGSDWLPLRDGLGTDELVEVARVMEREGIDAVEVSVGHYESGFPVVRGRFWRCLRGMADGSGRHLPRPWRVAFSVFWPLMALASNLIWRPREGFNLDYARRFKAALSIPVLCVGGFLTREAMEAAIEDGLCDAVSCGRAFIADPFLYRHLREGVSGPRCVSCNGCVGTIGSEALDCVDPRVRREKDAMLAGPPDGGTRDRRPG